MESQTMIWLVVTGVGALLIGVIAGWFLGGSSINKGMVKQAQTKASSIIREAEIKAKAEKEEKILQAKEKFLQLKSEHDKSVQSRNSEISKNENRIKQKEQDLNKRIEEFNRKDKDVEQVRSNLNLQIFAN